jgi:hypoxia up-regulated 1
MLYIIHILNLKKISFYNKERIYEDDAVQKRTKNPRNSFVFLNKFLGALANDQEIIKISK